ncbi:MAG: UDP-N-acetylmuramoyl-L-alanine--D-glutamate ligase [Patescibacteria group bacterium]|nr:UDP-N-acetylmuramoyl-L-alanine--D-glutamate ligase [Patescibacteria group bacterium]
MHNQFSEYKNKKILIAGLGSYEKGSGISAARFFAKLGARVTVTDLKSAALLAKSVRSLRGLKIKFVLGKHRISDFREADIVVKNPGMRRSSEYLAAARKAGAHIESDMTIFFRHCPCRIIGVTGTRGKSTTTSLIYEMLKRKYRRVFLGGNIKISPLNFLHKLRPGDVAVVELSSWMLEDLNAGRMSPHGAVITNVMRDHLNTYNGMKEYGEAKAMILAHQNVGDFAVLNRDNKYTRQFGARVIGRRFWFSLKPFIEENGAMVKNGRMIFREDGRVRNVASVKDAAMRGEHNLYNSLAALAVAKIMGVPCVAVRKTLRAFNGLADRQELIREIRGVKYYNDTTATTPDAGIAALRTLGVQKNIILIAGGADKELIFGEWAKALKKYCKKVVLLQGTATPKMSAELKKNRVEIESTVDSMNAAVNLAKKLAKKGEIILLSPSAASFGLFRNEFDRGEQFIRAVRKI